MIVKIQNRRGGYSDYDPSKLLPGEFAVVQVDDPNTPDGKAVYIAITAGNVVRLATADEIAAYNEQSQEVLIRVQENATTVQQYMQTAQTKANEAAQSATQAEQSQEAAEQAKDDTQALLDQAGDIIDGYADDAQATIAQTLADAQATLDTNEEEAITAINQAYQDRVDEMNEKIDQMLDVKSNAEEIATEAKNKADGLENELSEVASKVDRNTQKASNLQFDVDSMIHDWYIDTQNRLIFTDADGNPIGEPISGIGGGGSGGGGGSSTNAEMSAQNTTGWIQTTVSEPKVSVKILWSSIENDMPTGNGVATIRINSIIRASYEIPQGEVTFKLNDYLGAGTNVVKITITDVYDQQRTIGFNVVVQDLRITSSINTSSPFEGAIPAPVTPYGEVEKTLYWELDGQVIHTQTTSASGRQISYTIPAQSHGAHKLRMYFECEINNQVVRSNVLYYEFISLETLNNTPIIISPFTTTEVSQYSSVIIPFTVYDPANATTEITLRINGEQVSKQTVDRTEQSYTLKANTVGTLRFEIVCGKTSKVLTMTVTETDIDVEPETEDLVLYLSSQGRSNNEENPDVWTYGNITTTFTGNNHVTDGWIVDAEGNVARRFSGDARGTINYKLFEKDFRTGGKTITIEFAARNVLNYDTPIISCLSDSRGLSITPQMASLMSEQSSMSTQFKEDEHLRLDWVIEKRSEHRIGLMYINGIICGAIQYPDDDDFSQAVPVNISLGSSDCVLDIYCIRVYDNNLTKIQVLNNWIADTLDGNQMLDRYNRNSIYDAYGNIVISQLPKDLPYMIIECEELPQYKGDKKTCSGRYVDPVYPSKSFTFTNAQFDVQGTSSQYYPRKNYKTKFKGGFTNNSGNTEKKYAMNANAVPTSTFTFKKDFASSEGANNVELARAYNDICPYKTPGQVADSKVRQGIDGFPIVVFWHDTATDTISFVGKYNFNNDKGTPEVFGFYNDDESWEIKNNTGNRVIWKDNNYAGTAWLNDFEARYPDTDPPYTNPAQLQEFATWAMTTDTTSATGNTLAEPVTYTVTTTEIVEHVDPNTGAISYEEVEVTKDVTFTTDTAEYRLAKFKDEASNYMEMDSALFYYLFTELFLMVDSRAKNAFPSFMGSEVIG